MFWLILIDLALGFQHMHNAPDRDNFIKINEENIVDLEKTNFAKCGNKIVGHFDEKYDYYSIMHYDAYSFSKNLKPTIEPLVSLRIFMFEH